MFKAKLVLIFVILFTVSCLFQVESEEGIAKKQSSSENVGGDKDESRDIETAQEIPLTKENPVKEKTSETEKPLMQNRPRTVKDFFMLLPEKYFTIECCQGDKKAYLKQYLTVEDTKNGYLDGGGDGAQSTFKMALFKRPNKTYIIALNVFGEAQDDYFFLDYNNGNWKDISSTVIPEYDKMKIYEIPRYGTKMPVFAKKVIDSDGETLLTEKGKKLYDLVWKNGKFTIKK